MAEQKSGTFLVGGRASGLSDPVYFDSSPIWAVVNQKLDWAVRKVELPL
jgi:hypothetical protein